MGFWYEQKLQEIINKSLIPSTFGSAITVHAKGPYTCQIKLSLAKSLAFTCVKI